MENIIRVLHVAQAAGGVDRYIRMLFKYMDHDKFENILICSYDFKKEDYKDFADYFEQIDMRRPIDLADFKVAIFVRKLIKKYNPDIVYAHSSKAGAIVRVADIGLKNVCLYNPHGWAFNMKCSPKKRMLYTIIEKLAAPFCDKIVCISEVEKQSALKKIICREEKLQVIVNGVDIEEYEQRKKNGENSVTRERLGISKETFVVGMVGRISEQKAPDVFVKSAKLIKEKIPNSYFIIVGDGEQRNLIEEYAEKHGISDSLLITGWVENALDYVDIFDVALLLSRWEGFGLAIPEYMLAEKPVIATAVDAIPSIITNHVNGVLIPVNDVKAVVGAVDEIVNDKKLRCSMVEQGIRDVHKRFDSKRVAQEHGELFEMLLK